MGMGYLKVTTRVGEDAYPVTGTLVIIKTRDGHILHELITDENGETDVVSLEAPSKELTLDSQYDYPAYSKYDVDVIKRGYMTKHFHDVEIVDTEVAILPVEMSILPLDTPSLDEEIYIPDILAVTGEETRQIGTESFVLGEVIIPEYITVHLGTPTNASARNVRVKFPDYVKNVASSEIYPTWPTNSLIANIHVIVTFALNRVFTEWYRSRGFNFDITNSTAYDQYFVEGRNIYQSISQQVDLYFQTFARRYGFRNPFFTQFCSGKSVTCPGLSQWGTVDLANQGYTPLQILRYYYPDDIILDISNNIVGIASSYPGTSLTLGSSGTSVLRMQNFLNRIAANYPLIPQQIPDGIFGTQMQTAVRTFQRTFNLQADGVIGRATWNKISFIYVGITKLAELDSEGERIGLSPNPPTVTIQQGSRGQYVAQLQFILDAISPFYPEIPTVIKDSVFGPTTKNAVIEFQRNFGLTPDGIVGAGTWNKLYAVYRGVYEGDLIPDIEQPPVSGALPYPGYTLRVGSTGENVRTMQAYLNTIRSVYQSIPRLIVDGVFGSQMQSAVIAFQREFVLTPDGVIGPVTWNKIVEQFLIVTGNTSVSLVFPGTLLRVGSRGQDVRLMQTFLTELRSVYTTLPTVSVDGIFGPNTRSAVVAFQQMFGLTPDGIIGMQTWNKIVDERNRLFG